VIVSVASGKGGTGKTLVATNLALSLGENVQFLDCDVEEPNAHIFLKPEIENRKLVYIPIPRIDQSKCNFCGKCAQVCAYNAIAVLKNKSKVLVFSHLCHGCGGCTLLCPQKAISETGKEIGMIETGKAGHIQFIDGRLNIGEAMPVPVIKAVKGYVNPDSTTIVDCPPGTSCPVIESVRGSNFCVLVTEPTPFGLNDLILAVDVLKKLDIPHGVIINRFDMGDDKVELYCKENKIPILMRIPFDMEIAFLYSKGTPILERFPEYKEKFKKLFLAATGFKNE